MGRLFLIKILSAFILITHSSVFLVESIPTSSILPVRKPHQVGQLSKDNYRKGHKEDEGFLYLEKTNSNATFFQVLSSIPPAELNAEGSKTFYYYENNDRDPSPIEHLQVKFSHQQKTKPIEVPESIQSTAISSAAFPTNHHKADLNNYTSTTATVSKLSSPPKILSSSVITNNNSNTSISSLNTIASAAPIISGNNSIQIKQIDEIPSIPDNESTPFPSLPLSLSEPQAETSNSTIITNPSLDKKEAHLELADEKETKEDETEDDSVGFRGFERSLGPDWNSLSPEDKRIRRIWGGSCKLEDWKKCSHIESYGGDYFVKDKKNPDKMILRHHEIKCFIGEERTKNYCLKNGWTVARCHLLCMSLCNNAYRNEYDKVVSHEGACSLQFGR